MTDFLKNYLKHEAERVIASGNADDHDLQENVHLKLAHMFRVEQAAEALAAAENLPERDIITAAALMHDCARFEQYEKFRTYCDARSFDHGDASAAKIQKEHLFERYGAENAQNMCDAIRGHNKIAIPENLPEKPKFLCKIVRDCDKLDIFRVLLEYLQTPENKAVVFGLSEEPVLTPGTAERLLKHQSVPHDELATVSDFLASKFVWAYDLNFRWSRQEFLKRSYFQRLAAYLPETPVAGQIVREALAELNAHA